MLSLLTFVIIPRVEVSGRNRLIIASYLQESEEILHSLIFISFKCLQRRTLTIHQRVYSISRELSPQIGIPVSYVISAVVTATRINVLPVVESVFSIEEKRFIISIIHCHFRRKHRAVLAPFRLEYTSVEVHTCTKYAGYTSRNNNCFFS